MNKNKKITIITIISLIVLTGIYLLYNTYALTTKTTNNGDYYTINLTDSNIVSLAANEEKTVIYQINNTNNGTVSYGVAYNNSNIEIKVYSDSKDKVTGTIGANDNKYVKLHLKNKTSSNTTVEITAVMGYENGGDLIVPSDSTLVTNTYTKSVNFAKYITDLYTNAPKVKVTNNNIEYNYAPSVKLMNDRLGGTTSSLDGGNIRYYGLKTTTSQVQAWKEPSELGLDKNFTSESDCIDFISTLLDCSSNYSELGFSSQTECETGLGDVIYQATNGSSTTKDGALNYFCSREMTVAKKTGNNYVYFNCENYPNTNCELWRIIGVFNNQVKLIRNEIIGKYSWDTSEKSINYGSGVNQWSQADLMKLLNPGHESESVGGSLYYNSKAGTCYTGNGNTSTSCDFTNTGLKNDTTRNMIAETTYNTGGWNEYDIYSNVMYEKERGTIIVSNPSDGITRTTTWTGKIALPYPSDYGYAMDFSICSQKLSYRKMDDNECLDNNWLVDVLKSGPTGSQVAWLLTPYTKGSNYVYNVNLLYSNLEYYGVTSKDKVAPVLYLNTSQNIVGGDGSQNNPYQLKA